MPRLLSTLPLVALLTIGTALTAQEENADQAETTQTTDVTEDAPATADAAQGEELDMGQDVQENGTYIKEEHGDWQMKCFRSEAEEDPCQMYQLLREDAGNPVAEFSLFRLPEGAQAVAGATIVVPLGTLLSEELKISVDGGKAKTYPFRFCSMVGCFAQVGLTQADINAFKAGAAANLQIVPAQAPDQTVNIKASLTGFTDAYDNVSVAQN
ncbi:invasion associated locus B family protein [Roseovarius sp. A21]|uniref:Invasion associated locus B family protein n=1 Tax=Roseovarius bejariae TaxID=2576383 RepID=A0A844CZ79_9RHOB|nr:invasion associated locus B family protein [Roseovarius bejariae]MRU14148.1 invasion associated locus B family protein [Roseovarius bejariae]